MFNMHFVLIAVFSQYSVYVCRYTRMCMCNINSHTNQLGFELLIDAFAHFQKIKFHDQEMSTVNYKLNNNRRIENGIS